MVPLHRYHQPLQANANGRSPPFLLRLLLFLVLVVLAFPPLSATAFVLPTFPSQFSSSTLLSAADGRGDGSISRAGTLQSVAAAAGLLLLTTHPTNAAVPTFQEYYGGEGAQPKTNNYIMSTRKQKQQDARAERAAAASTDTDVTIPADPKQLLSNIQETLGSLIPMIKIEGWDDVLAATKKKPLNTLFMPYLGYGTPAGLAEAIGGDKQASKALEEGRQEAGVALQQLVDYAFSNRVIFFNSLDKQQVSALASGRAPPDLSEPLGLLQDTVALVEALQKSL
ncbi:hypothetical protein VYU27_009856 [Nannochloropsis oceanica]